MVTKKVGARRTTLELPALEELSKRELAAFKFIVRRIAESNLHQPPSQRELMEHLNTVLPKQLNGKPALISTQQTHRIATSLRVKGYLVDITDEGGGLFRNMVPTETAKRIWREAARH